MTILFNRALLLAKTETVFDEDALPDQTNDAFLVIEPSFEPEITQLNRDNVRTSLSKDAPVVGRKIGRISFTHEVRSNGNTIGTVEPRLGRFLKACGMTVEQVNTAAETLENLEQNTASTDEANWAVTTAYAQTIKRKITLRVVQLSPARIAVSALAEGDLPAIGEGSATYGVSNGAEVDIYDDEGNFVVGLTPDFGTDGNLQLNDTWDVYLRPLGYVYTPISQNFESITIKLFYPDDSGTALLHTLTGARGTFQLEATGGQFGRFIFTFTGSYNEVVDQSYPASPVYETTRPAQVELANLVLTQDGVDVSTLCASQWTIDMQVELTPRDCVNNLNAYKGAIITDRNPVMGMDPEATLEATHPFWGNLSAGVGVAFRARIGTEKGNVVGFYAPNVTTTNLTYQERNSIRAYDFQAALSALTGAGDDELEIYFS